MKIKNKIIFISFILLVLLSITCVSAAQEIDENNTLEASDAINEVSTSVGQTIQISESNSDNAQLSAVNYEVEDSSSSGGAITTDVLNSNSNIEDGVIVVNAAETYDLKVTANGDSSTDLGASNDKIDVYFVAPDRILHVEEIDNGYSYPVILRDVDGNGLANKPVTLTFNGKTQTLKTNNRGWAYFNVSTVNAGYYSVSLDFAGDSDYNSLSCPDFREVNVIKWNVSFVAPNKKFNVDEVYDGYTYGMTLRDSDGAALAGKKITFTFNGKTQTKTTNANGRAYFNLSAGAGVYQFGIDFAGDNYYNALSEVRTITVIGRNVTFVAPNKKFNVDEVYDGYTYGMTLRDSEGTALAGKKITFTFNGKTQTKTTNANGRAYFNLSAGVGVYQFGIDFAGDSYYNALSELRIITVVGCDVSFVAPNKKLYVDEIYDGYSYGLTLRDSDGNALAGKKVTVTFNGVSQTKTTNANGRAYFTISAGFGVHSLLIDFAGDSYYNAFSDLRTIEVIKRDVVINTQQNTFTLDEISAGAKYSVLLRDSDGNPLENKPVTFTLNGNSYVERTDSNGYCYFNLTVEKGGYYPATIKFDGNRYYKSKSLSKTIRVIPIDVDFVAQDVTVQMEDIAGGYSYQVRLVDVDGNALENKKVTITFNGKTQTRTTDSNGYCYFTLTVNKKGTYPVSLEFAGDNYYNPKVCSNYKTITVNKDSVIFVVEDNVPLDKAYFGYNYPVLLKDSQGNVLANKKITFTFKGIKQTGTTNSKGYCYFTLTADAMGTFEITIEFAGDTYYSSKKLSKNIKITESTNPYGTKDKKVWIIADGGSDDMKNAVANLLKKLGWAVHVGGTGPSYHYTDYFNELNSNDVYIVMCNGFCAGSVREAYSDYIQGVLKKRGVQLVMMWDTRDWTNPQGMAPYRYGNFTGYTAHQAWDDDFSKDDPTINDVGSWLESKNSFYCAYPSAEGLVEQFVAGGYFAYTGT